MSTNVKKLLIQIDKLERRYMKHS